jgi:para-aminobenzoate synthetase
MGIIQSAGSPPFCFNLKTLIIDNYDSFTFNLFQYFSEINGEPPLVVRNDEMTWPDAAALGMDNIVISPGPGRPELLTDFGICGQAILESELPILGVCLGHQGIGHFFGGFVKQAPEVMHGRLSEIIHDGDRIFHGIPSPFKAVRYHSLIVDNELPYNLKAIAWTNDGILMGLAHTTKPIWGVQFHPESICTEYGYMLLSNFRDLTLKTKQMHSGIYRTTEQKLPKRFSIHSRRLNSFVDPEAVFFRFYSKSSAAFWLHSAAIRDGMSRFSFMGDSAGPKSKIISYRSRGRQLSVMQAGQQTKSIEDLFGFLTREINEFACETGKLPFNFSGGFVGYLGYELKQECGGQAPLASTHPDAMFIFADRFIAFDHVAREIYLVELIDISNEANEEWFDETEGNLTKCGSPPPLIYGNESIPIPFILQHSRVAYLRQIENALKKIEAGESYEVCLTNQLITGTGSVDSFTLYRILQRTNPAPFSAFLKFPDLEILSSSPERFLLCDRNGRVETKPIKGTAPRGDNPQEDIRLSQHLRNDEKTRSENLMIVDLVRNDLGRVCEPGSVKVTKLMDVESYATVHQLVSTIEGTLAPSKTMIDCIKSMFPGGSMTGAPKIRTMDIIDCLEGAPRGVYSGAIGYLSLNETADLSIVIRTIVSAQGQLSIGIGGAIVALSDPNSEFDETMLKARAIIRAIALSRSGSIEDTAYHIEGIQ